MVSTEFLFFTHNSTIGEVIRTPMPSKITLRDVARLAEVSLGTASNVINNRDHVSEEARIRVMEAAAALNYQAPVRTGGPQQRVSVIGAVGKADDDSSVAFNPFYSYVLAGIEQECHRLKMSMMMASIKVDRLNRPIDLPPMLSKQQLDGLLMVGTFMHDTIQMVQQQLDKPVVLVDAYAPGSRFDSVLTDNLNGAQAAVVHLIEQGHRRIGLIGSLPNAHPSIRERRKGYLRALKHHRISQFFIEDSLLTREAGYEATVRLLRRSPEVSAIFVCNDEVAVGVLSAARDLGRSVPEDLSVIGFDDIDLAAQLTPALTTVRVDKVLMGVLAVQMLRDRAEHPNRPTLTMTVGTELVIRGTSGRMGV